MSNAATQSAALLAVISAERAYVATVEADGDVLLAAFACGEAFSALRVACDGDAAMAYDLRAAARASAVPAISIVLV